MIGKFLVNKSDEMFNEALREDGPKSYVKASVSGMLEGAVDVAIVAGTITMVGGLLKIVTDIKNK